MKEQAWFIAAAVGIFCSSGSIGSPPETNRSVTVGPRNNLGGAGGSFMPSFSDDGRIVAFVSFANNLVKR